MADYFSDSNDKDVGKIEYDISAKKVLSFSYSRADEATTIHYDFAKAVAAVEKLVEYNKFPATYRYIWY